MSIFEWLGFGGRQGSSPVEAGAGAGAETETVRRIVKKLDDLPRERARFIAAFAYILNRIAHADMNICDDELAEMEKIVMREGGLPEEQAVLVVQMAKTQSLLFGGTENYLVTREFNGMASQEEKRQLLHCLFAVSAADGSIRENESRTIRQVADELRLEHREYIEVRSHYREWLEVFKSPGEASD